MLKRTLIMVAALAVSVIGIGLASPTKATASPAVGACLQFQDNGTNYSVYVRAYVSNGRPCGMVVIYDGKTNIGGSCSAIQVASINSAVVAANVSINGKPAVLRVSVAKSAAGPQAGYEIIQNGEVWADSNLSAAQGKLSITR